MTSLLAIAVHCSILTQWLTQQVTGLAWMTKSCQLDMADNAFDDQYEGCTEEMEKKAPRLLKKELEVNKNFKNEWDMAKIKWKQIQNKNYPKQFNDFHGTALVAYTGKIATEFNKAVREFHQNSHNFQFKAFHYYLTRALQLLSTGKCYTVYRGCDTKLHDNGKGKVRFGQIASSSLAMSVPLRFLGENGTLFIIKTCMGVNIQEFTIHPAEEEVLIPGYEVYQEVTMQNSDKKYNEILLESPTKLKSNVNCFYSSTNDLNNFNSSDSGRLS
ncbi:T-cell ecto-ADP-ribosyltransferase 2-like isoform 1-T1 [Hipposideros larvatus]